MRTGAGAPPIHRDGGRPGRPADSLEAPCPVPVKAEEETPA